MITSAEWELAARSLGNGQISQDSRPFPAAELPNRAWFTSNSGGRTHAIGTKPAHPTGLLDMFGNAWTHTQDSLDANNYQAMPTLQSGSTLFFVNSGSNRVIRGGSSFYDARYLRSPARYDVVSGGRDDNVGLRLARTCP